MEFEQIISIHGGPRYGTSWLGQIFDSSKDVRHKWQPLFSDSFKNRVPELNTKSGFLNYYNDLYNFEDNFLDRTKQKEKGIYPIFDHKDPNPRILVTKHTRYHYLIPIQINLLDNITFVAIIRNPCGALNSFRKAPREFDPAWNFTDEWRFAQKKNEFLPGNYFGFHRWKEFVKLCIEMEKKYPKNFNLITYEELAQNTDNCINKLFSQCNLKIESQTIDFISKSKTIHNDDVYSVFKGNKNIYDWQDELPSEIISEIYNELKNTEFERFI